MRTIYICVIALLGAIMVVTPAAAMTWNVYEGGSIQAAIDNASDGDTVFVHAGTYLLPTTGEIRLYVNKPNITLKGEGADKVTIDGNGGGYIGIGISGYAGGAVDASGSVVEGFRIINTPDGIGVLEKSPNCIIRDNIIRPSKVGIATLGLNATIMGNVIDGGSEDYGTIMIMGPYSTVINNIVKNATGVYGAMYIANTSCCSTIANNTIINNTGAGIFFLSGVAAPSGNHTVTRNNIISNELAGFLFYDAPAGNEIYLNNIADNSVTATTYGSTPPAVTYWNSTKPIEYTYGGTAYTNYLGNYWSSDYSGADGDSNGIGDTSYVLPESLGEDYRPLMSKFENYPAPTPAVTPTPTPKPANASVSLGASIRAAIAIEVTPSSINYGDLAPGQTSSGNNLTVKNKGGYSIDVSAEVTDNSTENLFVNGALLNDKLWNLYSAVIPKNGNDKPVAKLHVPDDYAGAGSKEGTMMFWAKKA